MAGAARPRAQVALVGRAHGNSEEGGALLQAAFYRWLASAQRRVIRCRGRPLMKMAGGEAGDGGERCERCRALLVYAAQWWRR